MQFYIKITPTCFDVNTPSSGSLQLGQLELRIIKMIQLGTAVAQWLRCRAANRKVAGSIPADVIEIFH